MSFALLSKKEARYRASFIDDSIRTWRAGTSQARRSLTSCLHVIYRHKDAIQYWYSFYYLSTYFAFR